MFDLLKKKKKIMVGCIGILLLTLIVGTVLATGSFNSETDSEKPVTMSTKASQWTDITSSLLFHDQATYFLSDIEPKAGESITIRLRTEKDLLTSAFLEYREEGTTSFTSVAMTESAQKFDNTGNYDYWESTITVPDTMFYYAFKVVQSRLSFYSVTKYYYSAAASSDNNAYHVVSDSQKTDNGCCWKIKPDFSTPDWAKGTTWYSLMPDAFFNGDTTNDDHSSDENYDQAWNLTHNGLSDRYGGDLQGIMKKVEYIKSLGVQGVCYNPITMASQNAGYGSHNQNQIESTFGNGETYSDFISLMHDNDLRLVQDVAIYHTMRESFYYNNNNRWPVSGYAQGESSTYYSMLLQPLTEAWGGYILDNANQVTKNTLWATETAPLARYANSKMGYGVDGYRFDVGGSITGKDSDGNTVSTATIITEMRNYLKNINEDVLLISESSPAEQLNSGAWDGQWELELGNSLRGYITGGGGIKLYYLRDYIEKAKHQVLRGVTLCSHNQISTHDLYGTIYQEGNENLVNAAKMIQMTTLGSPSIYFGEEINYAGRTFSSSKDSAEGFSYFNWDETEWNYEVLNYHKSLVELRNKFTALKDGAIYELVRPTYDNYDFYAFGRFDQNGAVVTYINSTEETTTQTVNVSLLGVANGTIMTDWFTGKQYTVSNGAVSMDVPAGGTILVTGEEPSSYINGESIEHITVDGVDGIVEFVQNPLFNSYSKSMYVSCEADAKMTIMARNTLDADSMYYAITIDGSRLSIMTKEMTGGSVTTIVSDVDIGAVEYVKLVRKADNEYSAYLGTKTGSDIDYTVVSGSKCYIGMDSRNYVGSAVLSGMATFKTQEVTTDGRALFDDFDGPVTTSLLSGVADSNITLSDGKLTIPAQKILTTKGMQNDWTFKAKLNYIPVNNQDYAGVICKQDDDTFVVVGRMKTENSQKIFFAKSVNGELVVEYVVEDTNSASDVILQLQRMGSAYTAIYSYDGIKWNLLGDGIFFNLSDENVGITSIGTSSAVCDYVSFGNAIEDGSSYNAPRTPGKEIDLSGGKYNKTYTLKVISGNWTIEPEGFYQSESGNAQMSVDSSVYDSFRAEASLDLKEGASWAGMNFGKNSYDSEVGEGYLVKYTSEKKLVLERDGVELASYDCASLEGLVRVVVECTNESIKVYVGQDAMLAMNVGAGEYTMGYFSFCTNGPANINNYNVGAINNPIYTSGKARGYADKLVVFDSGDSSTETTVFLRGVGYTDFVLTTTLTMHVEDDEQAAQAGLVLTSSYGLAGKMEGNVRLSYSKDGVLSLTENGNNLCNPYTVSGAPKSIELMVVKKSGVYYVYVNRNTDAIMEFSEGLNRGGVPAFFTLNSTTEFDKLKISDICVTDDVAQNVVYTSWMSANSEKVNTYQDDFSTSKLIGDNYLAYNGAWEIKDGTLRTRSYETNYSGVTYVGNEYSDFVLTFKMKRSSSESSPGFAGVSFRKLSPKDSYDESGVTLGFYETTMNLIKKSGADVTTEYNNNQQKYAFTADKWHNIKVVCEGTSFTVYSDDVLIYQGADNEYGKGYITFRSGKTPVEFDDIKIISLSEAPEYLSSDVYTFDSDNVYGIKTNTTVEMLLNNINESAFVKVMKNGAEISGTALVGTGTIVAIVDNEQVEKEYVIVIKGDVNGDGTITVGDSVAARAHVLEKTILTGEKFLAADITGNGKITISDVVWINNEILKN